MPSYRVKLEICGSVYTVSTNDPAEYLQSLAERLDADMQQIIQSSANSSVVSAAIITALGYLDEETKTRQAADNMRAQIQDYLEDASKAKLAAEEARREVERLRRELSRLEKIEKKAKEEEDLAAKNAPLRDGELPDLAPALPETPAEDVAASQNLYAQPVMPLPEVPDERRVVQQISGQMELDEFKSL